MSRLCRVCDRKAKSPLQKETISILIAMMGRRFTPRELAPRQGAA
jgi:hypothetical protein